MELENRKINKKLLKMKSSNESNDGFSNNAIDNLFDDFTKLKTGGNLVTQSIPSHSILSKHQKELDDKDQIIKDMKSELEEANKHLVN